ncbi:hypothetical protein K435DRAFT_783355 [Dendrothele bispora CBS 962.96]|uniref:Uncharacterized protein n=1 Tax=Dendrothele bispora (strain CBS 962.96) TaxID=1314807 RepID=A0A4S8L9B3_DENBC|nr:hypothetical protein K435DRAFT_783355 [Dendrothele bispora CBS 962.96]
MLALPTFPPELIALIVKQLSPCRDSLRTCALVSRSWCNPAQSFLFSKIVLSSDADCTKWITCIRESPHLANLITELYVSSNVTLNTVETRKLASELTNVQCLEIDRLTESWGDEEVEFVCGFKDVTRLRLNNTTSAKDNIDRILVRMFQAMPAIMSLVLNGSTTTVTGLAHVIQATPGQGQQLQQVDIGFAEGTEEGASTAPNTSDSSTSSHVALLQNLAELVLTSVELDDAILEFLTSPALDLSGLRSLELQLGHEPASQIQGPDQSRLVPTGQHRDIMSQLFDAFLEKVLSLPECLVLSLPSIFSTGPFLGQIWRTCLPHLISHQTLSSLPTIRTLVLRLPLYGHFHILLSHAYDLLHPLHAPHLERLRIEITFTVECEPWKGGFNFVKECLEWRALDERFGEDREGRFRELGRVEIGVGFVCLKGSNRERQLGTPGTGTRNLVNEGFEHSTVYKTVFDDVTRWMRERMPTLSRRGILHFDLLR